MSAERDQTPEDRAPVVWPPVGESEPLDWESLDDLSEHDAALAKLRDWLSASIAADKKRSDEQARKELEKRRNPEPIKVEGNVTSDRLAEIKARYGDTLVSVREIEPFSMRDMGVLGPITQALNGLFQKELGYNIDVEMDPTLVSRYDANCSGMPEMPIDPATCAIRVEGETLTDKHRDIALTIWKATAPQLDALEAQLAKQRAEIAAPITIFKPMPDRVDVAVVYDSTDRTRIFGLCSKLLSGATGFAQMELICRMTEYIGKEILRTARDECSVTPQIRVAWHMPQRYGGRLALYMSPSLFPGQSPISPSDRTAELERKFEDVMAELQALDLIDTNATV